MDPTQAAQLDRIHHELTTWLENRRGPGGQPIPDGGADTILGYAANADGFGYQLSAAVADLHRKVDWLANAVSAAPQNSAPPPEIDYTRLAVALLQALGR